tara:strand:+ start:499 stop:954 length:456 start_codon:yes stop_codon:yes gene_type:complete
MNKVSISLFEPEIPQNTGNIIRLCANSGTELHLIEPLGFSMDSSSLKRSSLDYRDLTRVKVHPSWDSFTSKTNGRLFAISTKGTKRYDKIKYQANDILVFGPETRGLPPSILNNSQVETSVNIPMASNNRSINLSNAVAIVLFEALRQLGF